MDEVKRCVEGRPSRYFQTTNRTLIVERSRYAMAQRVVFTFDDNSLESLRQVQERGEFSSMGTAVREAVQLSEILQDQVADGFSEIVLRNPKTSQEKTLLIPSLKRVSKLSNKER